MFLGSAVLLLAMQTGPEPRMVRVRETDGRCEMRVDDVLVDEAALTGWTRQWIVERRQILIAPYQGTTSNCVHSAWMIVTMAGPAQVAIMGSEPGVAP